MTLTSSTYYALIALAYLTARNEQAPCSEICNSTGMPDRYVLQVLRKVTTAGLLKAFRGVLGGYRLARPAAQISILDVVTAVQGTIESEPPEGLLGRMDGRSRDVLTKLFRDAAVYEMKVLRALTIDQLEVS